jgi:hypothetical protein
MISTDAGIGTRRCILVVAQQIELRARILQGANALSVQALDEQKFLDQLGRPTASLASAGSEIATAPVVKIKDCRLDLPHHTFVDGSGREVHLTLAETALQVGFVSNLCWSDSSAILAGCCHATNYVVPSSGMVRNPTIATSTCSSLGCGAR